MREAELVSESAQWQTISCTDHAPGAGRHFNAAAGTSASAVVNADTPSSYCRISSARSASRIAHLPRSCDFRTLSVPGTLREVPIESGAAAEARDSKAEAAMKRGNENGLDA